MPAGTRGSQEDAIQYYWAGLVEGLSDPENMLEYMQWITVSVSHY